MSLLFSELMRILYSKRGDIILVLHLPGPAFSVIRVSNQNLNGCMVPFPIQRLYANWVLVLPQLTRSTAVAVIADRTAYDAYIAAGRRLE